MCRFPRVTKERLDKTWATATTLDELRHLYQESKNNIDIKLEAGRGSEEEDSPVKKKRKQSDRESPVKVTSFVYYKLFYKIVFRK